MNEVQLKHEFKLLHDRDDQTTSAINSITEVVTELVLRVRAYENIINRSWWLTRWLMQKKVVAEMHKINDVEGMLRKVQMERIERSVEQEKIETQNIKDEEKREVTAGKRTNKRLSQLRRSHKKGEVA